MGTQLPSPKKGPSPLPENWGGAPSPIFGPCLLWPNGWMNQGGTWHGGGPWSRPHCARWGPRSLPKKGQSSPIFCPFLLWSNGWMVKIPLGTEVNLGTGDIVLDRDPAHPKKSPPPIFGPRLLWPNGCMYQDTTWHGGRPQPRRHSVRWAQLPLP